jgi:hypothetical protein
LGCCSTSMHVLGRVWRRRACEFGPRAKPWTSRNVLPSRITPAHTRPRIQSVDIDAATHSERRPFHTTFSIGAPHAGTVVGSHCGFHLACEQAPILRRGVRNRVPMSCRASTPVNTCCSSVSAFLERKAHAFTFSASPSWRHFPRLGFFWWSKGGHGPHFQVPGLNRSPCVAKSNSYFTGLFCNEDTLAKTPFHGCTTAPVRLQTVNRETFRFVPQIAGTLVQNVKHFVGYQNRTKS